MALRHAVLAALLEGEASGYELSKRFDVSVANFWTATPQQLYRELDRLEEEGLIEARVVEQERRPNKRVWRVTDAGDEELFEFTRAPARPLAVRDDLLVKLQAIDAGDAEAVLGALEERLTQARAKLALYDRIRAQKGGVGAAVLRQRRCGGCSLELTAADLGTIAKAPADEVVRCEECQRILVRTAESGV